MQTRVPVALGSTLLLLVAAACSSGNPTPAPVRNYGPEAGTASSTTGGAAAPRSTYAPRGPATAGPIHWHTRLADAQAEARASGKMILVTSTKPRCSLCEKFKNNIAPAAGAELTRVAVGYVYDITRPEVRQVDRTLRANLRGADLMPLVGFLSADLGWIHGFWGQRSVQQFRGDIARALSIHPVRTAAIAAPATRQPASRMAMATPSMVINEYGEREWSAPEDVWPTGDPEPIDAITGAPDAMPRRMDPPAPTMLADAASPSVPAAPAPAMRPALPAAPTTTPAAAPLPVIAAAPVAAPAAAPAASTPAASPAGSENWGRRELEQALRLIRAGEFDRARVTLTEVRERTSDTRVAREASKGSIALYNAKRIRFATSGGERDRYLTRARRDFNNSMWAPLFNS